MKEIGIFIDSGNEVEDVGFRIMGQRFSQIGYNVHILDFKNINEMMENLNNMYDKDVFFYLGSNGLGTHVPLNNGKYLFEMIDALYISLLTDAPYNPYTSLMKYPCKNQAVIYLDKSHASSINYMYSPKKFSGKMFMPWGGYSKLSFKEVFEQPRDIDVIYSARFFDSMPKRVWRQYPVDSYIKKLLDEIVEYLEMHPETIDNGVGKILYRHGIQDKRLIEKMFIFYKDLFMYIKTYRRIKSLEFLVKNDIIVDVYGDGWEQASIAKNLRCHGKVSYMNMIKDISRAKIVYQDMAEFNHGGHDRVFTAMLNGAVVVSEYSSYLAQDFAVDKEIFFYDWQNGEEQVRIINKLLVDEQSRLAVSIRAYSKAYRHHRWENRAQQILEFAAINTVKN